MYELIQMKANLVRPKKGTRLYAVEKVLDFRPRMIDPPIAGHKHNFVDIMRTMPCWSKY